MKIVRLSNYVRSHFFIEKGESILAVNDLNARSLTFTIAETCIVLDFSGKCIWGKENHADTVKNIGVIQAKEQVLIFKSFVNYRRKVEIILR